MHTGSPNLPRNFDIRTICWEDVDTVVYAGQSLGAVGPALLRAPRSASTAPQTLARLAHDHWMASNAPGHCVLPPLGLAAIGEGAHGVLFADLNARPVSVTGADPQSRLSESLVLASCLLETLAALHEAGIVHGRVSPSTIWAKAGNGLVRLFDFSGARMRSGPDPPAPATLDKRFAAPEQLATGVADHRSDFYAMGAVLSTWVVDPLLQGNLSADEAIMPPELAAIVAKLMRTDPQDRYQRHDDLRQDLAACCKRKQHRGQLASDIAGREPQRLPPQSFYGRHVEQELLGDRLAQVRGGSMELVLVGGPPGVGKTRLVTQLQDRVRAVDGLFAMGKADQFKRGAPYAVFVQAFARLVAGIIGESDAQFARWKARVSAALGMNGRIIADLIPDIRHIVGTPPPLQDLAPVETRNRFYQTCRQFVRVFADASHPLCLVLDDLQWADPASFDLLEQLLSDPDAGCLLCLATYRNTEVASTHPLATLLTLESVGSCRVTRIALGGLSEQECAKLVADTLERREADVRDLSAFVYGVSAGNPFHLDQTLRVLRDRKLIAYDHGAGEWAWNIAEILEHSSAENVLELLRDRLQRLSPRARLTLMTAACLGNEFEAGRLGQAVGGRGRPIACDLEKAIDAGFLASTSAGYRFVHDRVQQAAFSLIRPERMAGFRLKIGRRLLAALQQEMVDPSLIEIVENLNCGAALISDPGERRAIAALNLAAGRKARASIAHGEAVRYLRAGLHFLSPTIWDSDYRLAYELHLESFKSEYQSGHFENAERMFRLLLREAATPVDQAMIYRTKILLDTNLRRYEEALDVAITALRILGVRFPKRATKAHVMAEIIKAKCLMIGKRSPALEGLQSMSHPTFVAATEILFAMSPPAYFRNPEALLLAGMKIVTKSIQYGNTSASAGGYVLYGLALAAALGDLQRAQEFGELAVALARRFDDIASRCRVLVIYGGFVSLWHTTFDDSLRLLRQAHAAALSAGDFLYANYAILQIIFISFSRGAPLSAVVEECRRFRNFVLGTKDSFGIDNLQNWYQTLLALKGQTTQPTSLSSEQFDETTAETRYRSRSNLTTLGYYLIRKLYLCYLFGDLEMALRFGSEAEAFIELLPGQVLLAEQALYFGLTLAGLRRKRRRRVFSRQLARCRRRLRAWAANCPANFAAMHLLLEAELATLSRASEPVLELFDRATTSARTHGLRNIEALAAERAAAHCVRTGLARAAQAYLIDAIEAYSSWQADAKVQALQRQANEMGLRISEPAHSREASQAISEPPLAEDSASSVQGDLSVADVLHTFLTKARQWWAAPRCSIILRESGHLIVRLLAREGEFEATAQALEECREVSATVVNFARRVGRSVVVENVASDERFLACPHFRSDLFRSVACLPMVQLGRVVALLYMEDKSAAISPATVDRLRLLCAETAPAIEAARMSGSLRQSRRLLHQVTRTAEELNQVKLHLERFVPASVRKLISVDPLAPDLAMRQCDVTVMFLDIEGFTALSERYEQAVLNKLIEQHFSSYLLHIQGRDGDLSHIAGDGMMLVFQRRETHVRQAIEAALAIRETVSSLNAARERSSPALTINIGINSGTALVGATRIAGATGPLWIYGAYGSVVNLAARISDLATGGAILISGSTAERMTGTFEVESLGIHAFKNVGSAIEVFRVHAARCDGVVGHNVDVC